MRWIGRTQRGAVLLITTLLASIAIAACGGSSGSSNTTTSQNAASTSTAQGRGSATRTALVSCLKQHGVNLPAGRGGFGFRGPRTTPSAAAGGPGGRAGGYPGGGGFAAGNSKFAKAIRACRSKLPASSFGPGRFGGGTGTHRFTPHF